MKARPSRTLVDAIERIIEEQVDSGKPLAVILSGHNGSGKSTLWYHHLVDKFQIPLLNADRMMLSILPEQDPLPLWAKNLRDKDEAWMVVAQNGVKAFVAQVMGQKLPFATETVFSHWIENPDGSISSKKDLILDLQGAGYFVLLIFVGLGDVQLSLGRVFSRVLEGGHDVRQDKLMERFPRTQRAISDAAPVADAALFTDNSFDETTAFTLVRAQLRKDILFDIRESDQKAHQTILNWLDIVCPTS